MYYLIMGGKHVFKILGSVGELNALHNDRSHKNIVIFCIDPFNFGLLIYAIEECRVSFLKLSVKEFVFHEDKLELNSEDDSTNNETFEINLLNILNLPFSLFKIIYTSNNIWAIGQKYVVDLKPYIESALQKAILEENDEFMDDDVTEVFNHETFDVAVIAQQLPKHDLHLKDIFIGCDFMKYGFIRCQKNLHLNAWQLEVVLINDSDTKSADVTTLPLFDFPVSFNKSDMTISSFKGQSGSYDPVILFINHNDPESSTLKDIFGINCSSSNIVCLIAHPDGKLSWSLCDGSNFSWSLKDCKKFHSSPIQHTLYDMKQPVLDIHFVYGIEEFEGHGCMLVIGVLGQITLFSSKKHPSLTLVPGQQPFWITTSYLNSSITSCAIIKNCLFYLSNGTAWITDLSMLLSSKEKSKELCLTSNSSELCSIEKMIDLDKKQGLILFLTSSGNMYLTVCKKIVDSVSVTSSLPSLMNKCLQQSTMMQDLLHKKFLQNRLFATISAFASIKFCADTLKGPITFSISEVNSEPRKYILVINLDCLEKLHLDSDLCSVSATVFTYFKRNFSLITKTALYNSDQPTLCLELTNTVLQPPFVSIFPLFVEVGLILKLPEEWKSIDCFKSITNGLPFYLRVKSFMVHEIHLLQSNVLCPAQSFRCEKSKALKIVQDLAMKRPISNILKMESKKKYQLPAKFYLCLSASSVNEMMKDVGDCDPCEYVTNILLKNKQPGTLLEGSHSSVKKDCISVEIANKNDHFVISLTANSFDSLIGLRIAVMEILLATYNQNKHLNNSSTYVNIPASIYRKCEDISKSLMSLYGKDVESDEVMNAIIQLYQELRREVLAKLPIL